MKCEGCALDGLRLVTASTFSDSLGFLAELYSGETFGQAGITHRFVQDSLSYSRQGVLRGLHFQNPFPQAKLVCVLRGTVHDVVVDLRRNSRTFGNSFGVDLSARDARGLFIPVGFAHGFEVLSENALVFYKLTETYRPDHAMTLQWDDPELAIRWPIASPILSEKDRRGTLLRDIPAERLFDA